MNGDTETQALLGDEAVSLAALHAGISAAYGYPGTPSTEIMEYLMAECEKDGRGNDAPRAAWCANEKTALEAGLGASFAGRRSIITMKHVGLNVAADPLINGALLGIKGGLVIAAADDPGMHSSQNEQDSRFYASFAMIPCLEPRSQQEAYDMAREAFDLSERFHAPVMLRLTTRLSHARSAVIPSPPRGRNPLSKMEDKRQWMLLPVFARKNYASLIEKQKEFEAWSASHPANRIDNASSTDGRAVITSGLAGNYYDENLPDLAAQRGLPSRLHIGVYPLPLETIRTFCAGKKQVLVIEEGQPFIEDRLRGILPQGMEILGRRGMNAPVPRTGELDPDNVRSALGLPPRRSVLDVLRTRPGDLPGRPPQLCAGCPHADSYETINRAAAELDNSPGRPLVSVNSDIGCYSLGASPPYSAVESIVCMGASVGMARGAADAGIPYAFAVIGDSTFIHSGVAGLIDAVEADTPMTLVILDNSIVAMTGCQPTAFPSAKLKPLILGTGLDPAHYLELEAKKQLVEENAAKLKKEALHRGLSVVVFRRECLEAARKRLRAAKK
ncbi:MAG: indolepyruvate ferredoxin oxidoreductase subunit alpha [Treponema sp.]|jgi:indolepyruvate ferredoxin oxidoreductase alpha subunit|nr:indolepyruvate ferredoxin oxidoreductase subunit alpha [Treponema sp.]